MHPSSNEFFQHPLETGAFGDAFYGLIFYATMALLYNLGVSRKSHRYGTSDWRKTTTNYDKYGYEVTALGSSSIANGKESSMHVLRVQPGVVVNFIETPSSSSRKRNRSWTAPRVVEYKSSPKDSHSYSKGDIKDSSFWAIPHSHGEPVNDRKWLNSSMGFGHSAHGDPDSSPTTHHYIPDEPFPDLHYEEPRYQEPYYSRTNHIDPHLTETHHMEPHYPESHYPVDSCDSPLHVPSPVDIPLHSHPSDHADYSLQSPSIPDSDMTRFNHGHSDQIYYMDHRQSPDTTDHVPSSPRGRRHSFDFPIPAKQPSSLSSSSNSRTVRFREDPVLPSPPERRRGWWNRRGDQLWDNDGAYAAAPERDKYPSDLRNYPEAGVGWMNEAGVQIDMKHRLVQRKPLRSALKKSSL